MSFSVGFCDRIDPQGDTRLNTALLRKAFTWLNRFTGSLLKQQSNGKSLSMNRRRGVWDDNTPIQILTTNTSYFDDDTMFAVEESLIDTDPQVKNATR